MPEQHTRLSPEVELNRMQIYAFFLFGKIFQNLFLKAKSQFKFVL